ncbi:MAG: agmatinase [candidate division WOR-3 bacterium]
MNIEFANASYEQANTIILGIPYDRTSSFMPGSRFAPNEIRIATQNIEYFSPYFQKDVTNYKIYDAGDLDLSYKTIQQTFRQIRQVITKHLKNHKKIISLGGEHTITLPIVTEFAKHYSNLFVIQLDAHPDTRVEFLGEKFCHATVMNNISQVIPWENIFQLGLRSITGPVAKNQYLFNVEKYLDGIIKRIGKNPCYLTLDIDVIDCGLFPSVQTPIPNGITYQELFSAIYKMRELNIVGCDIVEFNPLISNNLTYASVVAEILRELVIMMNYKKHK